MRTPYLEVSYHRGRVLAAYYYLTSRAGRRTARTRRVGEGLLLDYAPNGEPLGIEIVSPSIVTLAAFNRVLRSLDLEPIKAEKFKALRAAS
ncbi:MAG TPA: hypothetical protein VFY71_13900 [Planctomycetota bacterium]|nr:hypothetical protein [Planctomycetota bacterium]